MRLKPTFFLCLLICAHSLLYAQENDSTKKDWHKLGKNDSLVITNMPENSVWNDYAPIMLQDKKFYFTSDRKFREGDKPELSYNEKIYVTQKTDSGWMKPQAFYFFNSDDQSALAGVSQGSGKLFVYKTYGNGDLYSSIKVDGKWSKPKHMKYPVNTDGHEQSAAEENGIMVISSDRDSKDGTHDIYWSKRDQNGKYTEFLPIAAVNTNADELDVRLNKAGNRLYFSSDGLNIPGNFDIFCSVLDASGQWQKPEALPAPINSIAYDRYFFDCDSMFFFTSDREGGKGGDDMYWGHVVLKKLKPVVTIAKKDTVVVLDTNRYAVMDRKLDSAGIKKYYARVQIGAYYDRTVPEFKRYYPGLKDRDIYIEKVIWDNGKLIHKFIINEVFKTIMEASVVQREMWTIHHITDAFVAIYDASTNERVAIYNTIIGKFVILKGDQKPFYF
jgi:hypothetical protein